VLTRRFYPQESTAYRFESTWVISQPHLIASVRPLDPPLHCLITPRTGCPVDVPIRVVFGLEFGISDQSRLGQRGNLERNVFEQTRTSWISPATGRNQYEREPSDPSHTLRCRYTTSGRASSAGTVHRGSGAGLQATPHQSRMHDLSIEEDQMLWG